MSHTPIKNSGQPLNDVRADWALAALEAFPATEEGETRQNVKDLMVNLGHLLARECGLDVSEVKSVMFEAINYFEAEVIEEGDMEY